MKKKAELMIMVVLMIMVIGINVMGIVCLIYYAIPYLTHDTTVPFPDAMLPSQAWENAGGALTIGFIPLMLVNLLGYLSVRRKAGYVGLLFFVPGILCLILAVSYWLPGILAMPLF